MSDVQLDALLWLHAYLRGKHGGRVVRHLDVNATSCPGRNYPWAKVKAA